VNKTKYRQQITSNFEFNSQTCAAGLALGWFTICAQVNHLGM